MEEEGDDSNDPSIMAALVVRPGVAFVSTVVVALFRAAFARAKAEAWSNRRCRGERPFRLRWR